MKSKPPKEKAKTETATTPSEFSMAIARIAVSQICKSVGFKSTQLSALDTLTLVTTKYLQAIATSASSFANNSNRTHTNLLDLINALHDVISIHSGGVSGCSTLYKDTSTLYTSVVLKDLASFVELHQEIPFAKPIPRNNTSPIPIQIPQSNELNLHSHIPKWLLGFPDGNSCDKRNVFDKRKSGELLWEESMILVGNCGGIASDLGGKEEGKVELGVVGRGRRVRFRIGRVEERKVGVGVEVDLRNGVCRGGKRVCWNNNNDVDDGRNNGIGEDKKWRIIVGGINNCGGKMLWNCK